MVTGAVLTRSRSRQSPEECTGRHTGVSKSATTICKARGPWASSRNSACTDDAPSALLGNLYTSTRKRGRARRGVLEDMTKAVPLTGWQQPTSWVDRYVEERLRAFEVRISERNRIKALRDGQTQRLKDERRALIEERARLRARRNQPCGAMTRAGAPCRRKGLGQGGRCANHGGLSTGPKTQAGRLRIAEAQRQRWQRWRQRREGQA